MSLVLKNPVEHPAQERLFKAVTQLESAPKNPFEKLSGLHEAFSKVGEIFTANAGATQQVVASNGVMIKMDSAYQYTITVDTEGKSNAVIVSKPTDSTKPVENPVKKTLTNYLYEEGNFATPDGLREALFQFTDMENFQQWNTAKKEYSQAQLEIAAAVGNGQLSLEKMRIEYIKNLDIK